MWTHLLEFEPVAREVVRQQQRQRAGPAAPGRLLRLEHQLHRHVVLLGLRRENVHRLGQEPQRGHVFLVQVQNAALELLKRQEVLTRTGSTREKGE